MRLFVNHHKPLEYQRVLCMIIIVARRKGQGAVQHPISVRLKSRNFLTGPLRWEELGTEQILTTAKKLLDKDGRQNPFFNNQPGMPSFDGTQSSPCIHLSTYSCSLQ